MQQQFVFNQSADHAAENDRRLAEVGVSEWRRAVIWLMQVHPDRRYTHEVLRLDLSYSAAAQWLRKSQKWQHLRAGRSNLRRALQAWRRLGCAISLSRPTRMLVNVGRLSDWLADQQTRREVQWSDSRRDHDACDRSEADVAGCGRSRPAVAASVSDRVSEDLDLLRTTNQSLTHSVERAKERPHAATTGHTGMERLPRLPQEVWRANLSDSALYRLLGEYWVAWSGDDRLAECDPDSFCGAVLATRAAERTDPQRYCERCLELGVREHWVARARDWRRRQRRRSEQPSRV